MIIGIDHGETVTRYAATVFAPPQRPSVDVSIDYTLPPGPASRAAQGRTR